MSNKRKRTHIPDESSDEQGSQEQSQTAEGGDNFGFTADPDAIGGEKEREHRATKDETPEEKTKREELIREITRLISRYPGVSPRTNCALIESLQALDLNELNNVYYNAMNDIQEKRGTPAAEFMIMMTCWFPEKLLIPGITERCLDDIELVRDVDSLMTEKMGALGTVSNIIFRIARQVADIRMGVPYYSSKKRKLDQEALYAKNNYQFQQQQESQDDERDGSSNQQHPPPYSTYIHGSQHIG